MPRDDTMTARTPREIARAVPYSRQHRAAADQLQKLREDRNAIADELHLKIEEGSLSEAESRQLSASLDAAEKRLAAARRETTPLREERGREVEAALMPQFRQHADAGAAALKTLRDSIDALEDMADAVRREGGAGMRLAPSWQLPTGVLALERRLQRLAGRG